MRVRSQGLERSDRKEGEAAGSDVREGGCEGGMILAGRTVFGIFVFLFWRTIPERFRKVLFTRRKLYFMEDLPQMRGT